MVKNHYNIEVKEMKRKRGPMEEQKYKKLVQTFLDFGEAMLSAGAEIGRVEDSLSRLSRCYGAYKTDVFVITSSIVVTLKFKDGTVITESRRIRKGVDFDFEKMDALNQLARNCAEQPLSREDLKQKIREINEKEAKKWKRCLGSALAAGAFSLFFGGTLADGAVSALFGIFIFFLQLRFSSLCPNNAFFLFISSFLCGAGICILGKSIPFLQADFVIIGDIMLLVPGISITTAARDMVIGDTISGATRLVESLLGAATLACGFMLAMLMLGR